MILVVNATLSLTATDLAADAALDRSLACITDSSGMYCRLGINGMGGRPHGGRRGLHARQVYQARHRGGGGRGQGGHGDGDGGQGGFGEGRGDGGSIAFNQTSCDEVSSPRPVAHRGGRPF